MTLLQLLGVASMLFCVVFTWRACTLAPGEGQSPRSAIIEAWINIAIGFGINFVANLLVIPLATEGVGMTYANNWWMGWVFTAISMVRSYVIRRWFNARLHALAGQLAGKRILG